MATVKLNIKQWPIYMAALGPRMKVAIQRGVVSGANRCIPILQQRADNAVPASSNGSSGAFNTGNYRRRFRVRELAIGASVYNDAPYAGVIDDGRRTGKFPNLRAIEQWARRKLKLSAKKAREAAYPIARAIAKRGLKPRKVISGANGLMKRAVLAEVSRELDGEMRK